MTLVVKPQYGCDGAMGYKYRARIDARTVRRGFFWRRRNAIQYRWVIERHFMSWSTYLTTKWRECDKDVAIAAAENWLLRKEAGPKGTFV